MLLFLLYIICLFTIIIGVTNGISEALHKENMPILQKHKEKDWKIFNFNFRIKNIYNSISRIFRAGVYGALIYFPHISIMLTLKESLLLITTIYVLETFAFYLLHKYTLIENVSKTKKIFAYLATASTIIIPYILYYFLNK